MKFKISIFIFCFFNLIYGLTAQSSFHDFKSLDSKGNLPDDFSKYIYESKYQKSPLSYLFQSGLVVYGSEINQYLETILDQILKDYPDVRKEIRIYIFKSPVVNAMAFEDNILFVNIGLIAQVQNESELAFILAHEMIHIMNKHFDKPKKRSSSKNKGKEDDSNTNKAIENYMSHHYRSREHEFEADKDGFEKLYKNSGYDLNSINGVYDVLQFADLPFDEIPFTRTFLENGNYHLPDPYFLINLNPIRNREDYVDTLSTHPNILKRRVAIQHLIDKNEDINGNTFIQSEQLFYKIRTLARLECVNSFLTVHDFGKSFYNSFVMAQENPDNLFINRAIVASLYGILKHKLNAGLNDVIDDYKSSEGEIQQVNYFFTKIKPKELALLTLRFAWMDIVKYPDEKYFQKVASDIFLLTFDWKMKLLSENSFQEIENDETISKNDRSVSEEMHIIREEEDESDITPNEVKKTQETPLKIDPNLWINNLLSDVRTDSLFIRWVDKERKKLILKSDSSKDELVQEDFNAAEKIMVLSPNYYIIQSERSYKNRPATIENLINSIKIKDTQIDLFQLKNNKEISTDLYNIFCKMKSFTYDLNYSNSNEMILYHSCEMDSLIQYTGTPYLAMVDAYISPISIKGKRVIAGILAPLIPVLAPVSIIHMLAPQRSSYVQVFFVNVNNGNVIQKVGTNVGDNNEAYIQNFVYSTFKNLKKGEEK